MNYTKKNARRFSREMFCQLVPYMDIRVNLSRAN